MRALLAAAAGLAAGWAVATITDQLRRADDEMASLDVNVEPPTPAETARIAKRVETSFYDQADHDGCVIHGDFDAYRHARNNHPSNWKPPA